MQQVLDLIKFRESSMATLHGFYKVLNEYPAALF
jgi:hypothetical protein